MTVSLSRLIAYDILRDVDERDAYANLALASHLEKSRLNSRDAGFVTELVSGTLRMQGKYDRIIEFASSRDLDQVDPRTTRVLRLGIHQLTRMRVPAHAALSESVELQRRVASAKGAGFVNGVLRAVTRENDWDQKIRGAAQNADDELAGLTSHPAWVIRALRTSLIADGAENEIRDLLDADNLAPKVNMALLGSSDLEIDTIQALAPDLSFTGPSPIGWELRGGSPINIQEQLEGFSQARVQDQGSQIAALALTRATCVGESESWLDLCAGPGGKTAVLAHEALQARAKLRANEVAQHRAVLVERAVAPVSDLVEVVSFDGRSDDAFGGVLHDRILVDAPCSGLGALRRRPEARWRKSPKDIPELTALQEELLLAAEAHLKPGGLIAYVTCSSHIAETRGVVDRVLKQSRLNELNTQHVVESFAVENLKLGAGPHVQLWPHRNNTDAMFIALLQKPA